jgi:uncharacterized lipoprotein YehR (DUF1307 family)
MKKLFLLLLAAVCFASITACQDSQTNSESSPTASSNTGGIELPEDKFD